MTSWRDRVELAGSVLGLVVLAWAVWQMVPEVRFEARSAWSQLRASLRAHDEREKARKEIEFAAYYLSQMEGDLYVTDTQ